MQDALALASQQSRSRPDAGKFVDETGVSIPRRKGRPGCLQRG